MPTAALGAVLVMAALSLVDLAALRTLLKIDWGEVALSVRVTLAGLVLLRFNAPIVFFNAPQFKRAVEQAAGPGTRWLVIDMLPVTMVDATGLLTGIELAGALRARGVTLALAGRATQWQNWARSRSFSLGAGVLTFPSLEEAVRAYHAWSEMPHPA